jgi:archaellum component FlaF (FlaF/FlaG flagellin family)
MYKKQVLAIAAILLVSALVSFLVVHHEKNYTKKVDKIESTTHVRMVNSVKIERLTDDLDYGLNKITINDTVEVLIYNGSSKCSMVLLKGKLKKPKEKEREVSLPEDLYAEKHFDCYVEEVISKGEYVTECGIMFTSDKHYKKGQTLKDFTSPKHK